jgi:hypothetical protein
MMVRTPLFACLALLCATAAAPAPQASPAAHAAHAGTPAATTPAVPYTTLESQGTAQRGLFTIWRYKGAVLLELTKEQFGQDFIELGVPTNGIGAGIFSGMTDLQPVRIVRFVKQDDKVAILFPSTRFLAQPGTPVANAVDVATAPTVVGVGSVVSTDPKTGNVVFDASSLLQDVTDIGDALTDVDGGKANPMGAYRLDPTRSYFGVTKAFPQNVTITVNQSFAALDPSPDIMSVTPDARSLQMSVEYDIAAIPHDDTYMPRIYDDRVGYFVNAHQDFSSDNSYQDVRDYIVRWNMQPSDPSKRLSPAKKPIVYYLSDTIPAQYREPIRKALLTWNNAFERIGISNAVEVRDQPTDPSFDPDDIRYNVVRWLTETEGGFAEAQLLYNPYTGEMIKSGIVVDSDLMRLGKFEYPVLVLPQSDQPAGDSLRTAALDGGAAYASDEQLNYNYGAVALSLMNGGGYPISPKYADEFLLSIVLHESGHDFGLRHNFMGSEAYSAKQLQSAAFTARYGVASSVMEYSPINLWPKGTPQGSYFQTVLGPYDYYVIHWGYAPIPGARTPQQELPTLHRWASAWGNPDDTYSSDEDVQWLSGAGIDPRNQQWDLTNDNIGWCQTQMSMYHDLVGRVDQRFPQTELPYDDLRFAFGTIVREYGRCASIVSRYIGGEYVSRALRGDPHAGPPLSEIPIATQKRAFAVLQQNVFSAQAWNFSPALLRQLVTQYLYDDWIGNLPSRHDVAVEQLVARYQLTVLARLYTPVTLGRLDDMDMKYRAGTTMDLGDLFSWMQQAVYSDIAAGKAVPLVRRNLQRNYTALLSKLANAPMAGTPDDAQALARYELQSLHQAIAVALRRGSPDLMTRVHLEAMQADVERALNAHYVITMGS